MIIDVSIEKMEHLPEVLASTGVEGIILPGDRMSAESWKEVSEKIHTVGKKAYFAFPYVMRTNTEQYYRNYRESLRNAAFDGWLVRSLDGAAFLMEEELPGVRIFDQGMYVWNRRAVQEMHRLGADVVTLPYECRREELEEVGFTDSEMVIYGKIPMMISAQCTRKTEGDCRLVRGLKREDAAEIVEFISLRDRKRAAFSEDSHCRFCYSVIYNSVPLWLLDRIPAACGRVRLSFTDEKIGEPARILERISGISGGDRGHRLEPPEEFTRGHMKRGVE